MSPSPVLGAPRALYVGPLLSGLENPEGPFEVIYDLPAQLAVRFSQRTDLFRCVFLSPIDYARHGGEYLIVPRVSLSSLVPTNTVHLLVKQDRRSISTVAVDIRVTSEIILAKIILHEKFPNLSSPGASLQFIPMMPDASLMLSKADAALLVNLSPAPAPPRAGFVLDLIEEWKDLTDLPYVHGFWVGREEQVEPREIDALIQARDRGASDLSSVAHRVASAYGLSPESGLRYLSSFSYELGSDEEESLNEFFRLSYYHGVLGDVPDLNFFSHAGPLRPSATN